jgi:hypothetical protein
MDQSNDIHRYSLFMAREGMLVNPRGNGLSEIGKAFVESGGGRKGEATDKTSKMSSEKRNIEGSDGGLETKRFFSRAEAAIMKVKKLGRRKDMPCVKCRSPDIFNDCWWAKCPKH